LNNLGWKLFNALFPRTLESFARFLTLQEGIRRKRAEVGDLILIRFLGKQAGERFNRFHLEIEKTGSHKQ